MHKNDLAANTQRSEQEQTFKLELKDFAWLMHHLLPPQKNQSTIQGCQLLFPDTAFFAADTQQPGRAKDIIKTDGNTGRLIQVTQEHKLNVQALRTGFSLLVRERWKRRILPEPDIFARTQSKAGRRRLRSRLTSQQSFAGASESDAGKTPNSSSKGGGDHTT